jgi:glycosyltransferase involved in cell wall biosynthesis
MHIHVVTVSSGWILQKIAERLRDNNTDPNVKITVGHSESYEADVNYYCDLQNCYHGQKTKFDVAYFTHADMNSEEWLKNLLNQTNSYNNLKGIVSMNRRYTDMLEKVGVPKEKLITITPGQTHDRFPLKKITIGIVSRGGYPGYGQQFMERFLLSANLENFKFKFLGDGWSNIENIAKYKKFDLEMLSDADYSIYPSFYQSIDYLLIPGLWTAGPMSMQEALSTGVPVISADVGFNNYEFFADHTFETNNENALIEIFKKIEDPILKRRSQVSDMTWLKYSQDIINFIKQLKSYE